MKKLIQWGGVAFVLLFGASCSDKGSDKEAATNQPVYQDVSYQQDLSEKFDLLLKE